MKSKSQGFLTRVFMLALVAFLALPVSALAQGRGRDNRDGRWDRNDQRGDRNRNRDNGNNGNNDNNEWQRQQAERNRAEELRQQQERDRAEEWRRNQGGNNDEWRRNQGRNNDEWRRNQGRNDDRWGNNNDRNRRGGDWNGGYGSGASFALRQTALNAGYNNGIEEGRKDRRRGDRFDYRDEGDYQSATEDYSSRLGDRELYRRYFREGFANGYRAGYNGY